MTEPEAESPPSDDEISVSKWVEACRTGRSGSATDRVGRRSDSEYDRAYSITTFVATAAVTGVIGNITYDLLKAAMKKSIPGWHLSTATLRLRNALPRVRVRHPEAEQPAMDTIAPLAFYAVIERCREGGLPVPQVADLEIESSKATMRGGIVCAEITLTSKKDSSFDATVWLPDVDIDRLGINVLIRQAAPYFPDRSNPPGPRLFRDQY